MLEYVIGGAIGIAVGALIGAIIGYIIRKKSAEKRVGSAEAQAASILENAMLAAETKRKEMILEAKEQILADKNEFEREVKERRNELSRQEQRLNNKEENLDRKTEALEKREEALAKKIKEYEELLEKVKTIREEQLKLLERISGYSIEEARALLIKNLEDEVRHEQAQRLMELEAEWRENADAEARNIIALAIARCAADHVSEATISVVQIPNDDMKGRIIGREGRNVRTIENLTGVELIIDDTPEVITISGFDPVRREIARIALEKLIADGRIHPTRIEDCVERAKREVETTIKQAGEKATFETGVHGLNIELIKLLGRLKFRTSYGQNVLTHSIEVSELSGIIAAELGADVTLAKRAGLLHDIGKALTAEIEGSHVQIGVDVAKKYKESKEVLHAIEAHHGDVEPHSLIAFIVQAADAISAARPGARRENLENYIKRLEKLEEIANSFDGVEKTFAIQAGREIRIMVKPEQINDDTMPLVAREIVKKIESELEYPGQIKVNLIRESRVVDYAK
ncbi:MAG: ribonuclease Y [Clostridia bacterium]|nr:ribonuclease Y [Clostridia bacterium]MBR2296996.1 ribonuclease Y [Clostridia bacterium]